MTNSTALILIGWDDVLCRPIFRRGPAPADAKKRPGRKKSDVTVGTSSSSHTVNFSHPPPAPDEFKLGRGCLIERLADDTVLDVGSIDKDVEEKVPKRRRQSRAGSVTSALAKKSRSPSYSDSCDNSSKDDSRSCSSNQIDENNTTAALESNDFDDELTGVRFDDNSETSEIQSNNSIGTDTLAETRRHAEIETAALEDDASRFSSTVSVTFDEGDHSVKNQSICSPTSSIRFDQSSPKIGSQHSIESDPACNSNRIDCSIENELAYMKSGYLTKTDSVDASESNGTKSVGKFSKDTNASYSCKKTDATHRMQVSSPAKQCASYSNQAIPSFRLAESTSSNETISHNTNNEHMLNSPMLLKSNRERFEPSDIDTVNISPFDDFGDPAEGQDVAKQRSYGQGFKPNWASSKSSKRHKAILDPEAGEKQLVGWDDIKCRPIYQVFKSEPSQSDISMDVRSDTEEKFASARNKLQKRRTYSSSFRKSETFKQAYHNMDLNSPVTRRVTLENEQMHDDQDETSSNELNGKDSLDLRLPELSTSTLLKHDSYSCDEDLENRIQPTSKSSIESARAFFRYLDANHNLTISCDNVSESGSVTHANVVRTTRRISHSDKLLNEYDEYCKTVDGTGIDPIAIDEFAKHWNMYFTGRGIIRDGLLDED
ncbi:hypothetical protein ACHAXN_005356 [Cyclotella atomus]